MTTEGGVQYSKIAEIKGPLVVVDDVENAAFDELVEVETKDGERRLGKVLEVGNGKAIVQVFEGTTGLSISATNAKFVGKVMEMPVSKEVLGRVFDGLGRPKDGLPDPIADNSNYPDPLPQLAHLEFSLLVRQTIQINCAQAVTTELNSTDLVAAAQL